MMGSGKKRILIIEDDEEMRFLIKEFVEKEGYEADCVEKGTYAFGKLLKEPFDLIITDIRMPGFSGLDILPDLRKLEPDISIVVITAFGSEEVYYKALQRGANAYLEKPLRWEKLSALIHEMFSLQENTVKE